MRAGPGVAASALGGVATVLAVAAPAHAHDWFQRLGSNFAYVLDNHSRVRVTDLECGDGQRAYVNWTSADGRLHTLSDRDDCDNLPTDAITVSPVTSFRLCETNGICTTWKEA